MPLVTNAITTEIVTLSNTPRRLPAPFGRAVSTPVTTRLTHAMLARVEGVAAERRTTVAGLIRLALGAIADGKSAKDPMGVLADICAALGMPADSAPADVLASVSALVDEMSELTGVDPLPADGANENADPVPPPVGTPSLSRNELRAIARHGLTPAQFLRARAAYDGTGSAQPVAHVRRSVTELRAERDLTAKLKAKGLTPEAFAAAKAKAAKRV